MQGTILSSASQNLSPVPSQPSLPLLEEGLKVRLERLTFSAYFPLELVHESGTSFTPQNIEKIVNHLEITMIELGHLANELRWLQWIKAQSFSV